MTIRAPLLLPLTPYTASHLPMGHDFKILSKSLFSYGKSILPSRH